MATKEDVLKLAALARIEVKEEELEAFTKEFDAILAYVSQLEKLDVSESGSEVPALHNVMREDGEPHAPGAYTEMLVKQFPSSTKATEGRPAKGETAGVYLEVKQVIVHE